MNRFWAAAPALSWPAWLAYLVSQTLDIWIFSRLRQATKGRHLWLRNNLSTFSSQLIDSAVFVAVAFYGVFPISEMIIGQWIVKMIIAAIDTPLVYLGVSLLRSPEKATEKMVAA